MPNFTDQVLALTGGLPTAEFQSLVAGSSFEIQQLEGANPITVLLKGRAMPYQGVSWGVEQHSKITWYPGNPVATQQVLGPREDSGFSIRGMWKDRFIGGNVVKNGDASSISSAAQAVQLFEQLLRAGKRVRVQWAQEVRSGIIRRFKPEADRLQDWRWELEFEWSSRDDEEAPKASVQAPGPAGNDLLKRLNQLEDAIALATDTAQALVATVVSDIATIRDNVSKVVDLLKLVETVVNAPAAVLGALKAAVGALGRQIQDFAQRIGGPRTSALDNQTSTNIKGGGFALSTNPGKGGAPPSSSVAQELSFEVWRRTVVAQALALLFQLQRLSDDAVQRSRPTTTRIVVVKDGQSLYSLAQQFYGSPDFANFLALNNRLQSAIVPPGFRLRVPDRPSQATASIEPVSARPATTSGGKCC